MRTGGSYNENSISFSKRFFTQYLNMEQPPIVFTPDSEIHNAALFTLSNEDHTLGNLIHDHILNNNRKVIFCGYRVPHPYETQVELRIRTAENQPYGPDDAFMEGIEQLLHDDIARIILETHGLVDVSRRD
ncbi:hypothetical protein P9112_005900 [Eukaryota sp. TZLM1-RC]